MTPHHPLSDDASLSQFIGDQAERYFTNMERVRDLFFLPARLAKNETRSENTEMIEKVTPDILRSAVVFVHATLEDFLRSLAGVLLPYCDENTLNNIPLIGAAEHGRPAKFYLGRLAGHRGKTIEEVIQESVQEYLHRKTYSNTDEINSQLEALKIDISPVKYLYPGLGDLIKRRHQIVHRADNTTQGELDSIKSEQVWEWMNSVDEFMVKVIQAINPP